MAKYKTKRSQIFSKSLPVPAEIKRKVYDRELTIEDVIKYNLQDMVNPSCFDMSQRGLVYDVGIKKALEVDTALYDYHRSKGYYTTRIDNNDKDIDINNKMNEEIYTIIKERHNTNYNVNIPQSFRNKYPELFVEESNGLPKEVVERYYGGRLTADDIINYREELRNKKLVHALTWDISKHSTTLSEDKLNKFFDDFGEIFKTLKTSEKIIGDCLSAYNIYNDLEQKERTMKEVLYCYQLSTGGYSYQLSLEEMIHFSKVMPLEIVSEDKNITKFYKTVDISKLVQFGIKRDDINYDLTRFIGTYGIDNILEFDMDSGGLFSNNDFLIARDFFEKYMHYSGYGGYLEARQRAVYLTNSEGSLTTYSIDQFYEVMRRAIEYGSTDPNYAMNYGNIKGRFRRDNPLLFISEGAPQELKDKFYNKKLCASDFINHDFWLNYFEKVDITRGLIEDCTEIKKLLSSDAIITFISKFDNKPDEKKKILEFIKKQKTSDVNSDELKRFSYSYFISSEQSLPMLMVINRLGIEDEHTKILNASFEKLLVSRPELDINNPALSAKLLQKAVVEKLGINTISAVLEYNSGAHKVFLSCLDEKRLGDLGEWIKYIQSIDCYDKKLLHFAILSYPNLHTLSDSLCGSDIKLNEIQSKTLLEVLLQRNKYGVETIDDLNNYSKFRINKQMSAYKSDDATSVRDSIAEMLLNVSYAEAYRVTREYGFNSPLYVKNVLLKNKVISIDEYAVIKLVEEMARIRSSDDLRSVFDEILANHNIETSFINIEQKMKKHYNQQYQKGMFIDDGIDTPLIKHSTIPSVVVTDMLDKNGVAMDGTKAIDVTELNGNDFKIFIHKLHNYDPKFSSLASRIIGDPSLWNKVEGASTLSTSMISDKHMSCVGNGDSTAVYYGFNEISDKSLLLMGRNDIFVEHGGAKLEPSSRLNEFMTPDTLQMVSVLYNEVALDRKSGKSRDHDGRLQPNCVICFSKYINDDSKRAAQYFDIPIYVINKEAYRDKNANLSDDMTLDDKSDEKTIRNIMFAKNSNSIEQKYNKCLELVDGYYNKNKEVTNQCVELLTTVVDAISEISVVQDVSKINLDSTIQKLEVVSKSKVSEVEVTNGKRK